jgi:enoyl-CoA hydratase/carnithine racemase
MTSLSEYGAAFDCILFRRKDGIREIALHTNGGPFNFDEKTHHEFGTAFDAVAEDPENRIVILTGGGDRFCADFDHASFHERSAPDALQ